MSPHGLRSRIGLGIALALCVVSWVRAADPDGEQVLILQTGRLLKGQISRGPTGFVVEHAAGKVVVPFEQARVVGDDLPDAFRRLKETFVNPTAATHYELALWCSQNQLRDEMRAELILALDREPDHAAAREMLDRLDGERKAARRRAAKAAAPVAEPRMVNDIELPEVESLAGLSRETAALFTTRIQPLLINKCGNASCHGSQAENEFQLEQVRGTGNAHRVHSERNLAAVLKEIEIARPSESRLLQHGAGPHGGMARANFYGPSGEKQLKMLRNWVRVASMELTHDQQVAAHPGVIAPQAKPSEFPFAHGPVRQAAVSEADAASQASIVSGQGPASATPGPLRGSVKRSSPLAGPLPRGGGQGTNPGRTITPEDDDEEFADAEPDAFDPEEFNRRYHGKLSRPAASQPSRDRKTEP